MNNITGFQLARRRAKEKAENEQEEAFNPSANEYANEDVKPPENDSDDNTGHTGEVDEDNPEGYPELTAEDVDEMDIEELRRSLDTLEIKYAHNTGETKLRERLKDAII